MSTDASVEEIIEPSADGEPTEPADQEGFDKSLGEAIRRVLVADPTIMLDVLMSVLQRTKDAITAPQGQVYDICTPDGEPMVTTVMGSFEELVGAWRKRYQHRLEYPCQVDGYVGGARIQLSKDGRSVITPWGRFMLDVEGGADEPDPGGFLGKPLVPVKQVQPAQAVAQEPEPDEEDEEVDENDEVDGTDPDDFDEHEDDEG